MTSGIEMHNRGLLERLHRGVKGPFDATEAASLLTLSPERCRRLLSYLYSRGWLSRVKRGLYVTVPLGATNPSQWHEDPWVVAAKAFDPCYIGGWSALEHWGLTEQIFRDIVVVTERFVRNSHVEIQETPFRIKHLPASKHFGTRAVWKGQVKINVSDPSRTIVDILDDPAIGGGVRHISQVISAYFEGKHRSDALLFDYITKLDNRVAFKRLGYLLETLQIPAPDLIEKCRLHQSSGISDLDPTVKTPGRILKRWRLRLNVLLEKERSA